MEYGSLLKNKEEKPSNKLSWLEQPHDYKIVLEKEIPDFSCVTSAFAFSFKGEQLLMANVRERGWNVPGGHIERGETPEEAVARELFEETGTQPLYLGYLGYLEINMHGEMPPSGWRYPFPTSYLAFYWGVVEGSDVPTATSEVAEPKFFAPSKAMQLDTITQHKELYEAALIRAQAFADAYA